MIRLHYSDCTAVVKRSLSCLLEKQSPDAGRELKFWEFKLSTRRGGGGREESWQIAASW
jgi:hypothetical protein